MLPPRRRGFGGRQVVQESPCYSLYRPPCCRKRINRAGQLAAGNAAEAGTRGLTRALGRTSGPAPPAPAAGPGSVRGQEGRYGRSRLRARATRGQHLTSCSPTLAWPRRRRCQAGLWSRRRSRARELARHAEDRRPWQATSDRSNRMRVASLTGPQGVKRRLSASVSCVCWLCHRRHTVSAACPWSADGPSGPVAWAAGQLRPFRAGRCSDAPATRLFRSDGTVAGYDHGSLRPPGSANGAGWRRS